MTINIGMIGCGWIGGTHSRAIRALIRGEVVDARVTAMCDPELERAETFAAAHRCDLATSDPAQLLDVCDVVWICTPTNTHRALVEAAAAAGKAIYCEKPLATNITDVVAMFDAVEAAGVINQVGLVLRAEAPLIELRRRLIEIGEPMTAVFRDDQFFPVQGYYRSAGGGVWRADVEQAGGGALLEHSIHDLDLLAWLLGPIVEVGCRMANFAGHPGIEDLAVATLVHESGVTSTLTTIWHDVLSRGSLRRLEVFCRKALLWVEAESSGPIFVETDSGTERVEADTVDGWLGGLPVNERWLAGLAPYAAADRAFLDAVAGGRPASPGFGVAVQAHHVADAAYRSAAASGERARVEQHLASREDGGGAAF